MLDYSDIGLTSNLVSQESFLAYSDPYFATLNSTSLTFGAIKTQVDVGKGITGGYIRIDGKNRQIILNDGTNDRVLIGLDVGGF